MSIAIFGSYSYWSDGICWRDFSERGDLQTVVEEAAQRWFSYKEGMIIEDAIGEDVEKVRLLVTDRYEQLVFNDKRHRRIQTLKTSVRHCQQWLDNRDAETERLTKQLAEHTAELEELTK